METASIASPPGKLTFEEFVAWADEDTRAEWVEGEIQQMSPVSKIHQELCGFLFALLREFIEAHGLGVLFDQTFLMRLRDQRTGREPDLLFVSNANLHRVTNTYLDGPADLVVEIVSPESEVRDREVKLAEYERAGIPEYWLIDPLRSIALFYQLGKDGRYRVIPPDTDGVYRSRILDGLWLNVDGLWQRPLPTMSALRRELGLP